MTQLSRIHNFSAGPAALPIEVLKKAQNELLNWNDQGASVMELSHRGNAFQALLQKLTLQIKNLLSVPSNYRILFLHGGANGQFFSIPMNLLGKNNHANYVITGHWSNQAYQEALRYGDIHKAFDIYGEKELMIPSTEQWNIKDNAAYTYLVSNETLVGLQFHDFPQLQQPLVADMTSDLLTREIDVSKFGVIFAGTQKNLGIAGLCIVIVRDDLIDQAQAITPNIMHYKNQIEKNSCANTIPTFPCYMAHLVCEWIEKNGGIKAIEKNNREKAKCLYDLIDSHPLYHNEVLPRYRSISNVSFKLINNELEKKFLIKAKEKNLEGLKGHRSIGGMRASIYNGVSKESVEKLAEFMSDFSKLYY